MKQILQIAEAIVPLVFKQAPMFECFPGPGSCGGRGRGGGDVRPRGSFFSAR